MKTTVSAAFFTLLAAYECSAQYWQFYPARQFQPVWSVNGNGQQNNQGMGVIGNYQPPSNDPYSTTPRQYARYPQSGQNQAGQGQPQNARPSGDSELADRISRPATPTGSWGTPDSKDESSSRMPSTSRTRWSKVPSASVPEAMMSGGQVWNTPASVEHQVVDAFRGKTTTQRTLQPQRAPAALKRPMTVSRVPPSKSEDRIVYLPPGANAPDTTHNSLETFIPDEPNSAVDNINSGLRQFALDILTDMTTATPGKNVVISPYSVWAVMLVIYEGAEGRTATQIAKTLMFRDSKHKVRMNYKRLESALKKANDESHSDFVSGNGIFYDDNRPLMPDFERYASTSYQCQLLPVDFKQPRNAVNTINEWVASVTRSRIKMLVKPDDIQKPELIITNALFFKGQWKIPFNLTATHTDKFYDEQKRHIVDVRMMYQKGAYMYSFITEIGAHVLDMPYEDDKFRMLVVLPKPSSSVAEVLRLMKLFPVDQCYDRLAREQEMFSEDEVHVYLPRFKFGNRVELRPNLERLGITDVFTNRANLSSMTSVHLALGKVFHVSEIEVNEEGTVASAATAGGFVNKMGPPKFLANRPFAYFIVENSMKTVIFAGKVADPTKTWN